MTARAEVVPLSLLDDLARGWNTLTLSVEAPDRVPGWDAVVLTAASTKQATLYERQLGAARERGLIPAATRTLVVPDPEGRRIGSGGATLNALRLLARQFPPGRVSALRVLLVHAGGDSRRLPWANVFGKPFIPFPLLADADRSVPTLFEQLLAVTAPVALKLPAGGLLTLTGDVLPLFAAADLRLPPHGAVVVTRPVSPDVASRHGVIVPGPGCRVARLLQKPDLEALCAAGALVRGGAALIDTGIYAFTGRAFTSLLRLACSRTDPVAELLAAGAECSLYEEMAQAFVAAHRPDLARSAWGRRLLRVAGRTALRESRIDNLAFLHVGTSAELLEHLQANWFGYLPARVLSEVGPTVADSAFCYAAALGPAVRVGSGSLILNSRLQAEVEIGNRAVVVNLDAPDEPFQVPANTCVWQLPVNGDGTADTVVTACCGVDDNPKAPLADATFCNHRFTGWLDGHGVRPEELWDDGAPRTLWNARLFPRLSRHAGLGLTTWLLTPGPAAGASADQWRQARRLSLADLHEAVATDRLLAGQDERRAALLLRALGRAADGHVDRNLAALAGQLPTPELRLRSAALADRAADDRAGARLVPLSRRLQVHADLLAAGGRPNDARSAAARALAAVQAEVRNALRAHVADPVAGLPPGTRVRTELPVRFDVAGGWSDTPPYCLERPAGVLNLAMTLNGVRPVGVEVTALAVPAWELVLDDAGCQVRLTDPAAAATVGDLADPFALLRTALVLTGFGSRERLTQGVRVVSASRVPRGSGLGTSSILGAALVTALQRLAGRPADTATVTDLVLSMEQLMTTGGGWQDQVGGLVPGVKFIRSAPVRPLHLTVEPVPLLPAVRAELEQRLVIAFSGQERLAKNVLQMVVGRYLQRDRRLIDAIAGLVLLARDARRALAMGDLRDLGLVLREVWHLHQMLDPHCSNPAVDAMFGSVADLADGAKLAGAGGGGFMGVLAKDAGAAGRIRARLTRFGHGVTVYDWSLA